MRRNDSENAGTKDITISTLGGNPTTYTMAENATVGDTLEQAGYDRNAEVRCAGEVYKESDIPENGDRLIVVDNVKVKGA